MYRVTQPPLKTLKVNCIQQILTTNIFEVDLEVNIDKSIYTVKFYVDYIFILLISGQCNIHHTEEKDCICFQKGE